MFSKMNIMASICQIWIILSYLIVQITACGREQEQCYMDNSSPYVYFSSKTSYFASRSSQMRLPENCEPIFIWGLLRHSTRYPEAEVIQSFEKLYAIRNEIITNHKNGRGYLCERDLINIAKWNTNLTTNDEFEITPQGVQDEIYLAQKLKGMFPKLLKSPSNTTIKFQSSKSNRTKDSAIVFSNEIFGTNFTSIKGNNITEDDEFLQVFKGLVNNRGDDSAREQKNECLYGVKHVLGSELNYIYRWFTIWLYLYYFLMEKEGKDWLGSVFFKTTLKGEKTFGVWWFWKKRIYERNRIDWFKRVFYRTALGNRIFDGINYDAVPTYALIERLHYHCPRYTEEVENNPETFKEKSLFKETALMKKVIAEISVRLGYLETLSYDVIQTMYESCAYENAWYLNSKPSFCAAFLPEHLQVFEYLTDMHNYYRRGYGNSISNKMGCLIVRDMMSELSNAAKTPQAKKYNGKFLFTHSETVVPTVTKLGLFKDEESPRHDNYQKMIKQRKWKLSQFDSFAANIIAVLYKCSNRNKINFNVAIYQNERLVVFPSCTNYLCDLDQLQLIFQDTQNEDQCNVKFCQVPEKVENEPSKTSEACVHYSTWIILVAFLCNSLVLIL